MPSETFLNWLNCFDRITVIGRDSKGYGRHLCLRLHLQRQTTTLLLAILCLQFYLHLLNQHHHLFSAKETVSRLINSRKELNAKNISVAVVYLFDSVDDEAWEVQEKEYEISLLEFHRKTRNPLLIDKMLSGPNTIIDVVIPGDVTFNSIDGKEYINIDIVSKNSSREYLFSVVQDYHYVSTSCPCYFHPMAVVVVAAAVVSFVMPVSVEVSSYPAFVVVLVVVEVAVAFLFQAASSYAVVLAVFHLVLLWFVVVVTEENVSTKDSQSHPRSVVIGSKYFAVFAAVDPIECVTVTVAWLKVVESEAIVVAVAQGCQTSSFESNF